MNGSDATSHVWAPLARVNDAARAVAAVRHAGDTPRLVDAYDQLDRTVIALVRSHRRPAEIERAEP